MVSKILAIFILLFGLSGCALWETKKPEVVIVPQPIGDIASIPTAQPMVLKPVNWVILTRPELEKLLTDKTATIVLYSLDQDNLQNLTGNLDEMQRYILEQKSVIQYTTGVINLRRDTTPKDQNDTTKK
jgi:hypothetical protein